LKISREFKIGIFFILAAAAFIWGFSFLKGKQLFSNERTFYAVYPTVSGLVKSDPVYINGLKVGQVHKLYFEPSLKGEIIVEIKVSTEFPIPYNTISRIFSTDLMGSRAVDLVIGNSPVLLQNGDTLGVDIENSLKEEVNQQIAPLKMKAENLIASIDTMVISIQEVFNNEIRSELLASIQSVRSTFQNLESTSHAIDTLVHSQSTHIAGILYNLDMITRNIYQNEEKINDIFNNISMLSDSLAHSQIPETFANLNKVVGDLALIIDKLNNGEGTLGQLLADDKLYKELEKSAFELNQLLEDFRVNPKRYVRFSVF
jgi:phospholipid/cholesterol/gamma-HCH transport system substrate-binding protein